MEILQKATISLVVPAAGCGARTGLSQNKILAPIGDNAHGDNAHGDKPLLWHTLRALTAHARFAVDDDKYAGIEAYFFIVDELIIAARDEERDEIKGIWNQVDSLIGFNIVRGGTTRQESVANAVRACSSDLVAVHDAARPLVSHDLLNRVAVAALRHGAAIPALQASDTVKLAQREDGENFIAQTLPRENVYFAQTPQIFRRDILLKAIELAERDEFVGTDCASLVERVRDENGTPQRVAIVAGEARNFKVTQRGDLERAAQILLAE